MLLVVILGSLMIVLALVDCFCMIFFSTGELLCLISQCPYEFDTLILLEYIFIWARCISLGLHVYIDE